MKTGLVLEGGNVFIINPESPLDIGRLEKNPEKVQEVYDRGRADGEKCAESLIKWLAEGK